MSESRARVTYSCGHEGTISLFGRGKMREQQLQWARTRGKCTGCAALALEEMRKDACLPPERKEEPPEVTGSFPKKARSSLERDLPPYAGTPAAAEAERRRRVAAKRARARLAQRRRRR